MVQLTIIVAAKQFAVYMSTKLSINVNKIALLRNARGGDVPSVIGFAQQCEQYGVAGITIHPRPDQRHITQRDVYDLAKIYPKTSCEFNIEGFPSKDFIQMVCEVKPSQCTLVPDNPNQLTSDHGWDTIKHRELLKEVTAELQSNGIRVSLFIDPQIPLIEGAASVGADRIEFYTGPYALHYHDNKEKAIADIVATAAICIDLGLGINAGHDLNLDNLRYLKQQVPNLLEVSIGHAFVRDCLYLGLENTVHMYKRLLV